jgi:hypothetical protein
MFEDITIAILARDKAHTLPLFLKCISAQTFPKAHINIYIKTNNNSDNSTEILENWFENNKNMYKKVFFDKSDNVYENNPAHHNWNVARFNNLAVIRQQSIRWAKKNNSHYFTCDCDCFIHPTTLHQLYRTNLAVVSPLMINGFSQYSNYFTSCDENGYWIHDNYFADIHSRKIKGHIECKVVHICYLIRHEHLENISYFDDQNLLWEFIRLANNMRQSGIPQYLDNTGEICYMTDTINEEDFKNGPIYNQVLKWFE